PIAGRSEIGGSSRSPVLLARVACGQEDDIMNNASSGRPSAAVSRSPLVESGEAFRRLGGLERAAEHERLDAVVIGGGQAGLSVGYHLRRHGLRFAILDGERRVGDAWRKRWDSLRLFTPAKLDGLDGMKFPAPPNAF